MKKDIHPKYYKEAKVVCACGNSFITGSTVTEMHTEVCSACHPFYTGKHKLIDTAGRVDKFKARQEKARQMQEAKKVKKPARRTTLAGGPARHLPSHQVLAGGVKKAEKK